MSTKTPTETTEAPEVVVDLALDDWCQIKSQSLGRRVEALSAFYRLAQKAGVGRATAAKFEADFQAFLKSPA